MLIFFATTLIISFLAVRRKKSLIRVILDIKKAAYLIYRILPCKWRRELSAVILTFFLLANNKTAKRWSYKKHPWFPCTKFNYRVLVSLITAWNFTLCDVWDCRLRFYVKERSFSLACYLFKTCFCDPIFNRTNFSVRRCTLFRKIFFKC